MRSPEHSRLLKPAEAAALIGVSPETLVVWRRRREAVLPWLKVGGAVRYRLKDVERFISSSPEMREVRKAVALRVRVRAELPAA